MVQFDQTTIWVTSRIMGREKAARSFERPVSLSLAMEVTKHPSGEGHSFAVVDYVVDWMHEQDVIPVRTS